MNTITEGHSEEAIPSAARIPKFKPNSTMADINPTKNILSSDVEIKGSIKFQNELIIDGKIEGEINSAGVLTVGENAEIRGEIKTKSVTVLGKVHGNITVEERCELKTRAQLIGDLKAARLTIEDGATFVGKSEVTPNKVAMKQPEAVRNSEAQKTAATGSR
jgi:cytoskeletal protein CcmA (bactofilin family)